MLRAATRLALLMVVAAGALVAHTLAYLVAHPDPAFRSAVGGGHGYLDVAAALLAPAATVAVSWLVMRAVRHRITSGLSVWRLAAWQSVAFLIVEVVERIPSREVATVLTEPAVVLGLLLQLPVAALFVSMVGVAGHVVSRFTGRRQRRARRAPAGSWPTAAVASFVPPCCLTPVSRRGPPILVS